MSAPYRSARHVPRPLAYALRAGHVSALLATLGAPRSLHPQDMPPSAWAGAPNASSASSSVSSAWLGAWSPLRAISDISRGLLRAPLAPGLEAPAPMAGAFLLVGAPGSLARDLRPRLFGDTARFGELRVRVADERGDYHRPLESQDSRVSQVSGTGWAPAGLRGVAIGRFVVDRESNDVSSFTPRTMPYAASPFVFTDSVRPPTQRTRARLEGALGLRVGGFGLGASAGIDTREHTSVNFPLRRSGRATTPAINVGAERVLPWFRLRVGGYYRWSEPNETNTLDPRPMPTVTVYSVQGYEEPAGVVISNNNVLFVRNERRATAFGGTLELAVAGARVIVTREVGKRAEDQYTTNAIRVRATDRWRAVGTETRVQAQRGFGRRIRATVVGVQETLDGDATRRDLAGLAMRGRDEHQAVEADLRMVFDARWSAALGGGAARRLSTRRDFVVSLASRQDATAPFITAEVARRVGRSSVAMGASAASTSPNGALPEASAQGPNYRRLIAPALAYDVAQARAVAAWFTGTLRIRSTAAFASVRGERTTPTVPLPSRLQPGGDRIAWSVVLAIRP